MQHRHLRKLATYATLSVALTFSSHGSTVAESTWTHESSDIAVDSSAHFGVLENGLRYIILPNAEPPGRVSLRLHVSSGSLNEADDQRGLAHFLEHMVFNGSRNFPNVEELIPQMQRLGIAFGAHANAYTSFDETVYMLDLPDLETETLDLTFTVMRDFADGALLSAEEIDNERGVVIAELKSRDSVQMRLMEQRLKFMMPDSLVAERLPIGLEPVIASATRERFASYYEDNYNPQNMVFIAVGDCDVAEIETRIQASFGSMQRPDQPTLSPDLGPFPEGFDFRVGVFFDEEVSKDSLSLSSLTAYSPEKDTIENRNKYLPIQVAYAILNRRFQILSKAEGSPISGGSAGQSFWMNAIENHSIGVSPEDGKWPEAVAIIEQELRRALSYGFTQAEVDEIKAIQLNAMEESVKSASTRKSPSLASSLVNSVNENYVFNHPEESLRIYKLGEALITPEACHQALKTAWSGADLNLILTTKSETESTRSTLEKHYKESQLVEVTPPAIISDEAFAYTDFGATGTVISKTVVDDLDFIQLTLSNNIRINLKQTDFQKNSVGLFARFGSGKLTQPEDKTGLDMLVSAYLNGGGLGAHSNDELQRILAGRNVGYSIGVSDDAFVLSGATTPEDLELQLQLMYAGLTDPGYRDEALRQFHKQIPAIANQLKHTLSGAAADMQTWLSGNDSRFAKVDPEQLITYTKEDVQNWLKSAMQSGFLELSLIGDFDPDVAISLLLKTFGALPERANQAVAHSSAKEINTPDFPVERSFRYDSKIDKAVAMVSWKVDITEADIGKQRRMNVLASIVRDRLRKKLREELGSTYSPSAGFSANLVFETARFTTSSVATRDEVATIQTHMRAIVESIRADGISEDEFTRAIEPVKTQLEMSLRQNSYWLGTVLAEASSKPYKLDWARQRDADYASITVAELEALAKQYLLPDAAAVIELVPNATAVSGDQDAESSESNL
ncbi:MAG: insulinase family protein [Lentimonas sp.]